MSGPRLMADSRSLLRLNSPQLRHTDSPYAHAQLSPGRDQVGGVPPLWSGDNPELYCVTCISRHFQVAGSFHTLYLPVPRQR